MTVGDVCGTVVVTARPDETVVEAARRMRDRHVGDLVVADAHQRPVGMLTDRDIVVSAVAQSPDRLDGLLIGDVMTREVFTVHRADSISSALAQMRARGVRRMPVVAPDGRLDGIVTFDDILHVMSGELHDLVGVVAREQRRERDVRA
jgi:CBS domain-containing protein